MYVYIHAYAYIIYDDLYAPGLGDLRADQRAAKQAQSVERDCLRKYRLESKWEGGLKLPGAVTKTGGGRLNWPAPSFWTWGGGTSTSVLNELPPLSAAIF